MQPDTRKLLTTGSALFLAGALAAALMLYVFGGVTPQHGPHTDSGWMALMVAIACLPLGSVTLLLAFAKLLGDRHR